MLTQRRHWYRDGAGGAFLLFLSPVSFSGHLEVTARPLLRGLMNAMVRSPYKAPNGAVGFYSLGTAA
jgi:hypothetical protein